jgi:hypothetical protein
VQGADGAGLSVQPFLELLLILLELRAQRTQPGDLFCLRLQAAVKAFSPLVQRSLLTPNRLL